MRKSSARFNSRLIAQRQRLKEDFKMADEENVENVVLKKKKGSKKNKKGWRKKTDIVDVEEHLEDIRREERTGGVISEKTNEELFFVEKNALDSTALEKITLDDSKNKKTAQDSSDEEEYVPKKVRLQRKRQKEKEKEIRERQKIPKASHNPWGQKVRNEGAENLWVEPAIAVPPKKPKTVGEKPSSTDAVEVCEAGASYNPEYDDHQKLLQNALDKEIATVKAKEKLDKKVYFLTAEEFKNQPGWLAEMSEGLIGKEEPIDERDAAPGGDDEGVLGKTVSSEDRKTRKLRRKEKERIEQERTKEQEKLNKVRLNDVYRLKTLNKELKEEEAKREENERKKQELEAKNKDRPKRLGKHKYEDPKIDFQLSEDLTGSFREIKPEGDPFSDRMKSFEKRSLIEPRKKVIPHRKYKEKYVDKRSYKKPTIKDFGAKTT